MNCPKCNNDKVIRDGFANNRQRFFCKLCDFHFTVDSRNKKPLKLKRIALFLGLEGYSYRSIKKILNVSDVSIMKWNRKYSDNLKAIKDNRKKFQTFNKTQLISKLEDNKKFIIIDISNLEDEIIIVD